MSGLLVILFKVTIFGHIINRELLQILEALGAGAQQGCQRVGVVEVGALQ